MTTSAPSTLANVRRVVTGHNASGQSMMQIDDEVVTKDTGFPGFRMGRIWVTTDGIPTNDNNTVEDGAERTVEGIVTPKGTSIQTVELAPGASVPMHRSSSLDHNILISGEVLLITEDGREQLLRNPGDTAVQKGTMHAWKNPSDEHWARWMVVSMAAAPAVVNGVTLAPEFK